MKDAYEAERLTMVKHQLAARGITDPRVLDAMRRVPRHLFVPEDEIDNAYQDRPLPIGAGQTISQPYMVGLMTQCLALSGIERVLEIGTGSGYQAAILCELAARVVSIERHATLSERAGMALQCLGYTNFELHVGDGTLGRSEEAPYDRVIVTAAAPSVPSPLIEQLTVGGVLVIPVGPVGMQKLMVLRKTARGTDSQDVCDCMFVKLIGEKGYRESP